jgi:hypothetical protein
MPDTLEYEISGMALGTSISILSLLLDAKKPLILHAPSEYTLIRDLKRILNISDDKLTIVAKEILEDDIWPKTGDMAKMFSPYMSSDTVNLFGQQYVVGRRNKPCIGIAIGNTNDKIESNSFPHNRYYPRSHWLKLFELLTRTRYDIVTFDNLDVSIEQKIYMMNELCDCIIGYEGGICHLAHVLKIPTIILNWRYSPHGAPLTDNRFVAGLHLDKKTWITYSEDEILSWNPDSLEYMIKNLYDDKGNNTDQETHSLVKKCLFNNALIPLWTREFILTHIKNPQIGGPDFFNMSTKYQDKALLYYTPKEA